jgi:hypothetical protein
MSDGTLRLSERSSVPATPEANTWGVYATSDGIYSIDDTGATVVLAASSDYLPIINTASRYAMNGRLTLLSGTPVTTSDYATTDATTIYLTPYMGDEIGLHDGSTDITAWTTYSLSNEPHIHLDSTTDYTSSDNFDIWAYPTTDSVVELASTKWTNDTTRATALTTVSGVYCKTGATNYRYIGTIRMLAEGQCEDSVLRRFVWNYYNRVKKILITAESTGHTYNGGQRLWNNSLTNNRVSAVIGLEDNYYTAVFKTIINSGGNAQVHVGNVSASFGFPAIESYVPYISGMFATINALQTLGYNDYCLWEFASVSSLWYSMNFRILMDA